MKLSLRSLSLRVLVGIGCLLRVGSHSPPYLQCHYLLTSSDPYNNTGNLLMDYAAHCARHEILTHPALLRAPVHPPPPIVEEKKEAPLTSRGWFCNGHLLQLLSAVLGLYCSELIFFLKTTAQLFIVAAKHSKSGKMKKSATLVENTLRPFVVPDAPVGGSGISAELYVHPRNPIWFPFFWLCSTFLN